MNINKNIKLYDFNKRQNLILPAQKNWKLKDEKWCAKNNDYGITYINT